MEASTDVSNGSFHSHRQWNLARISMEGSTNFNGSKSTSVNFHGNFHGNEYNSTDFYGGFHGSKLASMKVSGNFLGSRSKK